MVTSNVILLHAGIFIFGHLVSYSETWRFHAGIFILGYLVSYSEHEGSILVYLFWDTLYPTLRHEGSILVYLFWDTLYPTLRHEGSILVYLFWDTLYPTLNMKAVDSSYNCWIVPDHTASRPIIYPHSHLVCTSLRAVNRSSQPSLWALQTARCFLLLLWLRPLPIDVFLRNTFLIIQSGGCKM